MSSIKQNMLNRENTSNCILITRLIKVCHDSANYHYAAITKLTEKGRHVHVVEGSEGQLWDITNQGATGS